MAYVHVSLSFFCISLMIAWTFVDYYILWYKPVKPIQEWTQGDTYWSHFCLFPVLIGHLATMWGTYYRTGQQWRGYISHVNTPSQHRKPIPFMERHDSYFGYKNRFWCLTSFVVFLNLYWFVVATVLSRDSANGSVEYVKAIGIGGAQTALLNTSIIMFLVIRRSVFQCIGFTAQDLIPLHRWLGWAMLFWATLHGICELTANGKLGTLSANFAFTDKTDGIIYLPGVFAWVALAILSLFALPQFRRNVYTIFLYIHRIATGVFFFGVIFHHPTAILWYYMYPSFMLLLIDRFVPRIMMARTVRPMATVTYNANAELLCMKLTSPKAVKPYYPGDYVMVQVPGLGQMFHPFTIASYYPEDPCALSLYMRVSRSNKGKSWTNALARLCSTAENGKHVQVLTNLNGIFGDKRHDYLQSENLIIFAVGASIVSFMPLLKAIGAQLASSDAPSCIKVQLYCSFKTQSELYAYGTFFHQITHDPRFTSWLKVQIHITSSTASNQITEKDTKKLSTLQSDDNESSTSSITDSPTSSIIQLSTISPTIATEKHDTKNNIYKNQPLPTHKDVSPGRKIWKLATINIFTLCMLKAWPGAFFFGLRKYKWETMNGDPRWCLTATGRDIWTTFVCQWVYAVIPGIVYLIVMFGSCYAGIAIARKVLIKNELKRAQKLGRDLELASSKPIDEKIKKDQQNSILDIEENATENGHQEVAFNIGRMNIEQLIQTLAKDEQSKGQIQTEPTTAVFAAGPDGFVDLVHEKVVGSKWNVEFYRETWSM